MTSRKTCTCFAPRDSMHTACCGLSSYCSYCGKQLNGDIGHVEECFKDQHHRNQSSSRSRRTNELALAPTSNVRCPSKRTNELALARERLEAAKLKLQEEQRQFEQEREKKEMEEKQRQDIEYHEEQNWRQANHEHEMQKLRDEQNRMNCEQSNLIDASRKADQMQHERFLRELARDRALLKFP